MSERPESLPCDTKIAGYTLKRFLDRDATSDWYEASADNGDRVILYAYADSHARDAARTHIHEFRTTVDVALDVPSGRVAYLNIGGHRVMMTKDLRDLLTLESTRPREVSGFTIHNVLGHGCKGVTFRATRTSGPQTPYALKLTIAEEYEKGTYLPEVDRMVDLAQADRDHFPQIHDCGEYPFAHESDTYPLVYFVEDFVSGRTVEGILAESPDTLTVMFLYDFVREMFAALSTLESCNLMHDDLHAGNVMLHEPPSGRRRPYLIDFGSAKPRGTTKKPRDDVRNVASQIAAIANAIQEGTQPRTAHEDRILAACESLLASIADEDPMRRPESAAEVLSQFERSFAQGAIRQELIHPFDFGNAEEVMDNSLLYSLAAKSFPWQDQIEASSHLLVIGPRGCGKTTVFRSMSFRCLADAGQSDEALRRRYVGLYISCTKEFRQRFSAIDRSTLLERQDLIRHYFNLVVLREFASSLSACEDQELLVGTDLAAVQSFVNTHVPQVGGPQSLSGPKDLEARVARAIHQTRMAIWTGELGPDSPTSQGFLADLASLMASEISVFTGKTLYLFVDDYTEGKVPTEAQRALNHILFVPNSSYKCKISSEVFGVTFDETYGNFLGQERDYREWNLGTLYCVRLPSNEQKAFLAEIVNTRLTLCNYAGSVEKVIGDSEYVEGTLERTLKRESEIRLTRRRELEGTPASLADSQVARQLDDEGVVGHYHGWDTVCDLCTGDVSNILELLNRMWDECGVKQDTVSRIPPEHQNAVIEGYSRQYIGKIKGIPGHGEHMFAMVNAFGNMSRTLLEDYPWVGHGAGREEPYRLIRIELDEAFTSSMEGLPHVEAGGISGDSSLELWRLLQRHCIFIDGDESRSRRNTLSSRVILRRIFCPAFRIGLVNSECWTLSRVEWEAFCADPTSWSERYGRRCVAAARRRRGIGEEQEGRFMFPDDDDEVD